MSIRCITSNGAFVKHKDFPIPIDFSHDHKVRIYQLSKTDEKTLSLALETLSRAKEEKGFIPLFPLEERSFSAAIQEKPYIMRYGSFLSLYKNPAEVLDVRDIEDRFLTYDVLRDPVKCVNGHIFERENILKYLSLKNSNNEKVCPCCKVSLVEAESLQEAPEILEKIRAYEKAIPPVQVSLFFANMQTIVGKDFITALPWEGHFQQEEVNWDNLYVEFMNAVQRVFEEIDVDCSKLHQTNFSIPWIKESMELYSPGNIFYLKDLFSFKELLDQFEAKKLDQEEFQKELNSYYDNLLGMFLEDSRTNILKFFDKHKRLNKDNIERMEKVKKRFEEWEKNFSAINKSIGNRPLKKSVEDAFNKISFIFQCNWRGVEEFHYGWEKENENFVVDKFQKLRARALQSKEKAKREAEHEKNMAEARALENEERAKREAMLKSMAEARALQREEEAKREAEHQKKMAEMRASKKATHKRIAEAKAREIEEEAKRKAEHEKKMAEAKAREIEEEAEHQRRLAEIQATIDPEIEALWKKLDEEEKAEQAAKYAAEKEWNENFWYVFFQSGKFSLELITLIACIQFFKKNNSSENDKLTKHHPENLGLIFAAGPIISMALNYCYNHYNPEKYSKALKILGVDESVDKKKLSQAFSSSMKHFFYLLDHDIGGFIACCQYLKKAFLTVSEQKKFSYSSEDIKELEKRQSLPLEKAAYAFIHWCIKLSQIYFLAKNKQHKQVYILLANQIMGEIVQSLVHNSAED